MIPANSLVFAIDDDPSVRRGLARLLRSAGYRVKFLNRHPLFSNANNTLDPHA